jgi:hypothetical protein
MNVKLVAASVLFYYQLAFALQTRDDLELWWRYAGWYMNLSNVKPTKDGSAPVTSQRKAAVHQRPANMFLFYSFIASPRLLEQKSTGSQFH